MKPEVARELSEIFGEDRCKTNPADVYVYGFDSGIHRNKPDAVVRPMNVQEVQKVKGISVLARRADGLNSSELRGLADSLKQKIGSGIVILGTESGQKVFLVVAVTKDLIKRVKANEIIKEIEEGKFDELFV